MAAPVYDFNLPYVSGNQSTGTTKGQMVVNGHWRVVSVRAVVGTAPATQALIVDLNKNGASLFSGSSIQPTIAASATDSGSAVPDVADRTLRPGDILTYDIDQVGTGTVGAGLSVCVRLRKI